MKKTRKAMALGLAMALALGGIEPGLATINVFAAENGIQTTADETREEITLTSDQLNNETLKGMDLTNKIIHLDPSITSIANHTFDHLNLSNSVLDFTGLTGTIDTGSIFGYTVLENTVFNFGDVEELYFGNYSKTFSNVYINVKTAKSVKISGGSTGTIHFSGSNILKAYFSYCTVHNSNILSTTYINHCTINDSNMKVASELSELKTFKDTNFYNSTISFNCDEMSGYINTDSCKYYNTKVVIEGNTIYREFFKNSVFDDKSSLKTNDNVVINILAFQNAILPECTFKPSKIESYAFDNCNTNNITLDLSVVQTISNKAIDKKFKNELIFPDTPITLENNAIAYYLDRYTSDGVITIPENITVDGKFLEGADLTGITKVIVKGFLKNSTYSGSDGTENIDLVLMHGNNTYGNGEGWKSVYYPNDGGITKHYYDNQTVGTINVGKKDQVYIGYDVYADKIYYDGGILHNGSGSGKIKTNK